MSKLFSIVEIENDNFIFVGKVTNTVLSQFEPLLTKLSELENTETLYVWVTTYWLPDSVADAPNRDLYESEIVELQNNLQELFDNDILRAEDSYYYTFKGALDRPYEDYYKLEGQDRTDYLLIHNMHKKYIALVTERLKQAGCDDFKIALWLRFNQCNPENEQDEIRRLENNGSIDPESIETVMGYEGVDSK